MSYTTDPQLRNFHQWIRAPVRKLLSTRHAGFSLAMIAFPVLERWTRGKVGIGSLPLQGIARVRFCAELAVQFSHCVIQSTAHFRMCARFLASFPNRDSSPNYFSRMPIKVFGAESLPVYWAFVRRTRVPIVTLRSTRPFILDPYAFHEAVESIVDYEGPAALSRAAFCFPKEGGCCYLGDQDIGARFESFHHCVVECHIAECPETAQIISDMTRQHCKSSKQLHTRLLIDQLAHAVSRKMRLKMGIEIEDVVGNK